MGLFLLNNGKRVLLPVFAAALIGGFGVSILARGAPRHAKDVVVTRRNWITGLTIARGATFRVPRPVQHDAWRVTYSTDLLRLLTPKDPGSNPGPEGWRFEARTRGTTEITFTGIDKAPGAQSNPPALVLKVRIR